MQQLQGRKEPLHSLAFSADNRLLVTGGIACRVDVWDLSNPSAKRPLFPKMGQTIGQVWVNGRGIGAAELSLGTVARLRFDDPSVNDPFVPEGRAKYAPTSGVVLLEDALDPATFLDPSEPVANAFKLFRKSHRPMAIGRDDGGKVRGLITMEDVLDEIVGGIEDEHDVPVPKLKLARRRPVPRPGGPNPPAREKPTGP